MSVLWLNDRLVEERAAAISPFDHGLTTGDGVFETLRVYRGSPFAVRRHLERLAHSAQGLGLAVPDRARVERAMAQVIEANALREGRLRITWTAGVAPLGSERSDGAATLLVAVSSLRPFPAAEKVAIVPWVRNERSAIAGLKTTSYAENVVALGHARGRGAGEAIFGNTRGELCEGTGTNVFVVQGGRLVTPPLASGCLAGVTRALVLELMEVDERALPVEALATAEEAFLTSSTREVQPIASVDGRPLAAPGPVTARAQRCFADLLARDLDP
ncbi:MAG TPA: aminotransferase class IV [Polyangiaceae bacterium]|nr:aminotransferase class IV [Polyangiaceae bacterium]